MLTSFFFCRRHQRDPFSRRLGQRHNACARAPFPATGCVCCPPLPPPPSTPLPPGAPTQKVRTMLPFPPVHDSDCGKRLRESRAPFDTQHHMLLRPTARRFRRLPPFREPSRRRWMRCARDTRACLCLPARLLFVRKRVGMTRCTVIKMPLFPLK